MSCFLIRTLICIYFASFCVNGQIFFDSPSGNSKNDNRFEESGDTFVKSDDKDDVNIKDILGLDRPKTSVTTRLQL